MQLEIYSLTALKDQISVSLEAICDSYSSLLWDIEFYQCGCFEVYYEMASLKSCSPTAPTLPNRICNLVWCFSMANIGAYTR